MKNRRLIFVNLILSILLTVQFSGCKNKSSSRKNYANREENNYQITGGQFPTSNDSDNSQSQKLNNLDEFKKIKADVDFTLLNFNMASAQVFNMMIEAEEYIGKTVKILGKFSSSDSEYGRVYSVLYYDATACCQTGLSFILNGPFDFPKDYPEELNDIAVYGTVEMKDFDGIEFMYIDCEKFFIP